MRRTMSGDTISRQSFGLGSDATQTFLSSFVTRSDAVKTLPEQLADKMVEHIVRGDYAPGQRLQEIALAEEFAVSRGPVREALRILETEGLVSLQPRRGASVARLTPERTRNIFGVRSALMALCAEDIARRRPKEVLANLEEGTALLEKALKRGEALEFVVLVYQLSMYISDMADNRLARNILFSLGRQTLSLTRRALEQYEHRRTWAANWQAIVRGIRDGDPVRAGHATNHLVETVCDAALAALEEMERESHSGGKPLD